MGKERGEDKGGMVVREKKILLRSAQGRVAKLLLRNCPSDCPKGGGGRIAGWARM